MGDLHNRRWMVISDGECIWVYDTEEEAKEHLDNIQKYQVCGYNVSYVLQQESGCYPLDYPTIWEHVDSDIRVPEEVAIKWVKDCKYTMNEGIKSGFWNKDYYVVGMERHWIKNRRYAIYKHDNKVWLIHEKEEVK